MSLHQLALGLLWRQARTWLSKKDWKPSRTLLVLTVVLYRRSPRRSPRRISHSVVEGQLDLRMRSTTAVAAQKLNSSPSG